MANYNNLKAGIDAVIKTNGRQEISGAALNAQLKNMITELGAGYQYMGLATPATNPGTPDANVFYLASEAGTYTKFGGIVINEGEVCALVWNGTWTKQVTGAATADKLNQLGQDVFDMVISKFGTQQNPNVNISQQTSGLESFSGYANKFSLKKIDGIIIFADKNSNIDIKIIKADVGTTETLWNFAIHPGYNYIVFPSRIELGEEEYVGVSCAENNVLRYNRIGGIGLYMPTGAILSSWEISYDVFQIEILPDRVELLEAFVNNYYDEYQRTGSGLQNIAYASDVLKTNTPFDGFLQSSKTS